MAVALAAVNQNGVSGGASLSISLTIPAGANRALLVLAQSIANDRFAGASPATWRGAPLGSPIRAYWNSGTGNASFYAWLLTAPEEGAGSVVLPCNNSSSFANAIAFACTGVDQVAPVAANPDPFNNTFTTSPRSLAITAPAGGFVADMIYLARAAAAPTPDSPQVAAGATMVNAGVWSLRGSYRTGAASAMGWSFSDGTQACVHGAIALNAASGGGGVDGSAAGALLTATASLIAGTATGSLGTLNFQAAGLEFGRRTGLAINTFALEASVNYRYTVHADALVLGAPIFTSGVVATDSAGKLPNASNAAFVTGQTVWVCAVRQADGQRAIFPMVVA